MPRRPTPPPRSFLTAGEWPTGTVEGSTAAAYAREAAQRLADALDQGAAASVRALARGAGVSHTTVNDLLAGTTYPDTRTLAALEAHLDRPLLPDWADRSNL